MFVVCVSPLQYDTTGKVLYVNALPRVYIIKLYYFVSCSSLDRLSTNIFKKKFLHMVSSILDGRNHYLAFFKSHNLLVTDWKLTSTIWGRNYAVLIRTEKIHHYSSLNNIQDTYTLTPRVIHSTFPVKS